MVKPVPIDSLGCKKELPLSQLLLNAVVKAFKNIKHKPGDYVLILPDTGFKCVEQLEEKSYKT